VNKNAPGWEFKNQGYQFIRKVLETRCISDERKNRAFEMYRDNISKHESLTVRLVYLIALGVIENA
jgi:hypothetical protein